MHEMPAGLIPRAFCRSGWVRVLFSPRDKDANKSVAGKAGEGGASSRAINPTLCPRRGSSTPAKVPAYLQNSHNI